MESITQQEVTLYSQDVEDFVKYNDVKKVSPERYFKNAEYSVDAFTRKYLIEELNEKTPADVFWRVATYIAEAEESEEAKKYWSLRWFHEFYTSQWLPGGSVLLGAANPNKISLSNCTGLRFGERDSNGDNLEDIHKLMYAVSKCAAYRQGLGTIFNLRPKGMKIKNSSKISSGNTHWMQYVNNVGHFVGQSGRIPALLFAIKDTNPDLIDFITVKSDQNTIDNANISVHWSDKFMKTLEENGIWKMKYVSDTGEKMETEEKASVIFDKFVENNFMYAEPGAQFFDTARKWSNSDYLGNDDYKIYITNACSEQFLESAGNDITSGLCVLGSCNIGRLPDDLEEGKRLLRKHVAPSMNRFLDNVVTMELQDHRYALLGQKNSLEALRRVGAGVTNLDGWLIRNGIGYDTDDGFKNMTELIDSLSVGMYETSISLGREKGNFGLFDREKYIQSPFVKQMMKRHGLEFNTMRNVALVSIAPTGSLSVLFQEPSISFGIEPVFGYYYWKRQRTSGQYEWSFMVPSFVRDYLKKKGIDLAEHGLSGESVRDESGEIGEKIAKIIDDNFPEDKFKPAHLIDPFRKVDLMAYLTKHCVDSAISVTYNLPEDIERKTIKDLYIYGWKQGLKSMTIYRDKSREGIVEFESPKIVEKRFEEKKTVDDFVLGAKDNRPEDLTADVYHVSVKGEEWIAIIGLYYDQPYEIFAGKAENVNLSNKVKKGTIKKKGINYFFYPSESDDRISLTKDFMDEEHSALTRQVSLHLRCGTPLIFVINQLEKSGGNITDLSKVINRVLKKYIANQAEELIEKGMKICPYCDSSNLEYISGCFFCHDCKQGCS